MVFHLAMHKSEGITTLPGSDGELFKHRNDNLLLSVFLTCRHINQEASLVLYGSNTFPNLAQDIDAFFTMIQVEFFSARAQYQVDWNRTLPTPGPIVTSFAQLLEAPVSVVCRDGYEPFPGEDSCNAPDQLGDEPFSQPKQGGCLRCVAIDD